MATREERMPAMPKDDFDNAAQLIPAKAAEARTYATTISSSTQVTFDADARLIEVYAGDQGVFLKWGTTAVTSSNFDCYVPADTVRHFKIPIDASTKVLYTACTVIERAATAFVVVIEY